MFQNWKTIENKKVKTIDFTIFFKHSTERIIVR